MLRRPTQVLCEACFAAREWVKPPMAQWVHDPERPVPADWELRRSGRLAGAVIKDEYGWRQWGELKNGSLGEIARRIAGVKP